MSQILCSFVMTRPRKSTTFARNSTNVSVENANSKQHKLKIAQLLTDLRSKDEVKVASAIKSFHAHGDASVIEPLIGVWQEGLSSANEALLMELFEGLKDTETVGPLMEAFRTVPDAILRRKLVSAFWNSKLDFSAFLADFILFAIEGDFLDAFEAITLIEQFESTIPESAILESQLLLKEYFGGTEGRDEKKDTIIGDLALLVKGFEQQADEDDLYIEG